MQWTGTTGTMLLLVLLPALVQGSHLQQGMTAGMMLGYKIGRSERQLRKLEDAAAELTRVSKLEVLETSLRQDLESWCSQASSTMEQRLAQVKSLINDKQAAFEEQKWNDKVNEVCQQQRHSFEKIVDQDLPRLRHNAVQESQTLQLHLRGAHQLRGYSADESDDYGEKDNGREEDTIEVTDEQAKAIGAGNDEHGEEAGDDDYSSKEVVAVAEVSSKETQPHRDSIEDDDSSDAKLLQSGEKNSDETSGIMESSNNAEENDDVDTANEEAKLKLLTEQAYLQLQSSVAVVNGHPENAPPIDFLQMGMESNVFRPNTKQAKRLCKLFDNVKNKSASSSWLKPLNQAEMEAQEAALALAQAEEKRHNNTQGIKECQDIAKTLATDIEQIGAVVKKLSDATTLVEGSAKVAKSTSKKIEKDIVAQHQWVLNGLQEAQDVRQKGREAQEQRAKLLSSKSNEVDTTVQRWQATKQQADDKVKQVHKQVDNIVETCNRMREEGLASLLVKGIHH